MILLSKARFKRINKYLGRLNGHVDKEREYAAQIRRLMDTFHDVEALLKTDDVLALCFSFMNYTRRR